MNITQQRILLILVTVFLGTGFILIATRPSKNPQGRQKQKDDFAAELKQASAPKGYPQVKIQWRVVVAKGTLKGKKPQKMTCPDLDSTGKSFLAELSRRYSGIQFSSPASGEGSVDYVKAWYPLIKYVYRHADLGTLHVSFPVALKFTPVISSNQFFVANHHEKDFHLAYDELFSSTNMQSVTQYIPITPLFQPAPLPQKEGGEYVAIGQTVLLESYSCHFQKDGKTLKTIDTHMLFYKLVKPEASTPQ